MCKSKCIRAVYVPPWIESSDFPPSLLCLQLMGRMGTPAECAKAALYLASDATFCTGINLFLSCGAELGYGKKSHQNATSGFDG